MGLKHHILGGCEEKEGHCWLEGSQGDVVRDRGSIEHRAPADSIIPVQTGVILMPSPEHWGHKRRVREEECAEPSSP